MCYTEFYIVRCELCYAMLIIYNVSINKIEHCTYVIKTFYSELGEEGYE